VNQTFTIRLCVVEIIILNLVVFFLEHTVPPILLLIEEGGTK